jgi:hypothetical protein
MRIGVLGGVGFPRPLAIEGFVKIEDLVLLGAEYSVLPQTDVSIARLGMWAIAADARVFPGHGPFYLGLRIGRQHLTGSATLDVTGAGPYSGSYSGSESTDATFLDPQVGFLWSLGPLAVGVGAGVQFPIATQSSATLPTLPGGAAMPKQILDVTRALSSSVLPTVDILRVGVVM